jgi:AcrR family transcriptional regulator
MPRAATTPSSQRAPLSRSRVLTAALRIVDAEGLDAMSMRRLGSELGVEAMSLYRHVSNKDALLDALTEQLWTEVRDAMPGAGTWDALLTSYAHETRAMMHRHPQAAALLVTRCVLPSQVLEIYARLLDALHDAGFDEVTAARTVRSIGSYATGYASSELYCYGAWRAEPGQVPATTAPADQAPVDAGPVDPSQVLLWLGRTLPPSTPSRLIRAAMAVLDCDPDADFSAGVGMAVQGLRQELDAG